MGWTREIAGQSQERGLWPGRHMKLQSKTMNIHVILNEPRRRISAALKEILRYTQNDKQ